MDFHKVAHDICNATGHWHLPLFVGFIGSMKQTFKIKAHDDLGDLGDAPGDNILPKEILISLSSRREIPSRL